VEKSAEPFLFRNSQKSAAHSSRTFLRGGNPNPAVLKKEPRQSKSFPPAKIVLLCLARIFGGQNPERKMSFPFFYPHTKFWWGGLEKIHPREKSKEQGTFFFGVAERSEAVAGLSFITNF